MISNINPKLNKKNMKKIYILDDKNNQLYFHFNDLEEEKKFKKIKNHKFFSKEIKIIVRWYDFYNERNYKSEMNLKKILKKGLVLIKEIIKKKQMNVSTLNSSGLIYILKKNNVIFIEPQFS